MFNQKGVRSEQEIIAEIHNEFDAAEGLLLNQAESLLSELKIPTESAIEKKAKKLSSLGFKNAESVKQAGSLLKKREEIESIIVSTKEQAALIKYYQSNYPFLKFITEDLLELICKKYNLVFAPVGSYIKDVPDKNILDIESATPLRFDDRVKDKKFLRITEFWDGVTKEAKEFFKGEFEYNGFVSDMGKPAESDLRNLLTSAGINLGSEYVFRTATIRTVNYEGLFIAAPPSSFDLTDISKQSKFGYMKETNREVKDPIVFRYVRGGIQIITKWGLEANDQSLVNEINN